MRNSVIEFEVDKFLNLNIVSRFPDGYPVPQSYVYTNTVPPPQVMIVPRHRVVDDDPAEGCLGAGMGWCVLSYSNVTYNQICALYPVLWDAARHSFAGRAGYVYDMYMSELDGISTRHNWWYPLWASREVYHQYILYNQNDRDITRRKYRIPLLEVARQRKNVRIRQGSIKSRNQGRIIASTIAVCWRRVRGHSFVGLWDAAGHIRNTPLKSPMCLGWNMRGVHRRHVAHAKRRLMLKGSLPHARRASWTQSAGRCR